MSHAPTVSIVMPVRNGAPRLSTALESIRAQTFPDWELVVVDDGSTDDTPHLVRAAAAVDARVRLLSQPPLGIAAALQHGCAAARGAFIARMDADDWSAPQRLHRQLEFLEHHPRLGIVSCRVRHGGDPATQAGYAAHVAWINSLLTPEDIALRRFVDAPMAHPSVMFRRELLVRHGGYATGDFPEDYELWLRWLEAGVQCGKVAEELLLWNDPPGRLSRTDPRYRPEAFYHIKSVYLARWLQRHVASDRAVWLWGAGRITRQRFRALEAAGVAIAGFIDVDGKKLGRLRDGRPVVGPDQLPPAARAFIVTGVAVCGARDWIAAELRRRGRVEGEDYLLAA